MKRGRINIVHAPCKRCGKMLAMTDRSIYGADDAKKKYGGICSDCITPEERAEIEKAIAGSILGRSVGK